MTSTTNDAIDTRQLAQERIVDALLRALASKHPEFLQTVRSVLIDTEFTHTGKPDLDRYLHQQSSLVFWMRRSLSKLTGPERRTRSSASLRFFGG